LSKLQSGATYAGPLDCAKKILTQEGPLAFYKGTVAPLIGIGACVALQFGCLNAVQGRMKASHLRKGKSPELSSGELYLAGAAAGLGNSVASGPVEHIRIRLQTQPSPPLYKGPIDCVKQIYRADGLRGIYQGQVATVIRELHGYGMYFLAYEGLVQRHCTRNACDRSALTTKDAMIYGVAAGWTMWLTAYPLDVIKSRMQTDGFLSQGTKRKFAGTVDCVRQLLATQGFKGFFKGLTPTLIRSPIANAATFAAYEATLKAVS